MLTIVITTYNRAATVQKQLTFLENQTSRDFEVVVAIDGSTDGTLEMLSQIQTSYPLRWIDTGFAGYGLAIARNKGILAARGETVVILDDDSFPEEGFVAAHLAAQRPGVMTCGPRHPIDPTTDVHLAAKMARLMKIPPLQPEPIDKLLAAYPGLSLVENNLSMSRADWISLGLFTERLKIYGVIGQEFFARARHAGAQWQFAPQAGIVHHSGLEGDNGLNRNRKLRQARIAQLLRPSIMAPRQYEKQTAWAQAQAQGHPAPALPYPWHAWLFVPPRLARRALAGMKRKWHRQ